MWYDILVLNVENGNLVSSFLSKVVTEDMLTDRDMTWYGMIWWYNMFDQPWYEMIWYDMFDELWYDMLEELWYDMWYDMFSEQWYGMIWWYDMFDFEVLYANDIQTSAARTFPGSHNTWLCIYICQKFNHDMTLHNHDMTLHSHDIMWHVWWIIIGHVDESINYNMLMNYEQWNTWNVTSWLKNCQICRFESIENLFIPSQWTNPNQETYQYM
jgi:hypothetical protein